MALDMIQRSCRILDTVARMHPFLVTQDVRTYYFTKVYMLFHYGTKRDIQKEPPTDRT